MLAVVDPEHLDLLVALGRRVIRPGIKERIVLEEILELDLLRIRPLGVAGFGLQNARFASVLGDANTKLILRTALSLRLHGLESVVMLLCPEELFGAN